jgi:hypothetical protein
MRDGHRREYRLLDRRPVIDGATDLEPLSKSESLQWLFFVPLVIHGLRSLSIDVVLPSMRIRL